MKNKEGLLKRFVFFAVILGALARAAGEGRDADNVTPKLDLTGVVQSGGVPVSNASVFIYTAGPRVGPGDI